jgi:hypothetical protein
VFLTQVQLWRILWPLHLFAVMSLPVVIGDYWIRGWAGRWVAAAACLAGLATMSNWPTGWLCLLWLGAALVVFHRSVPITRLTAILAIAGSAAAMLAVTVRVMRVTIMAVEASPDRFAGSDLALIVLGLPLVSAAIAAGALLLVQRRALAAAATAMVLAGLAAYGLTVWDQRSPWQKHLEGALTREAPLFDAQIANSATVYWQSDMIDAWLLGRRGDYYASAQGAGLLFNRDNALQFARRQDALAGVELQHAICLEVDMLTHKAGAQALACNVSPEVFAETCQKSGRPDFFVFTEPMPTPPIAQWHAPAGISAENRSFYLYRCPAR